jgi:hypothetical protein
MPFTTRRNRKANIRNYEERREFGGVGKNAADTVHDHWRILT